MGGFWEGFGKGLKQGDIGSALTGTSDTLGKFLKEGTQNEFNKYLETRRAAVKGEYDKYVSKFDTYEELAEELASLAGDPTSNKLGNELTGMEFAARFMQGKSTSDIKASIERFKALRDQDQKSIRDLDPTAFIRSEGQQQRDYTAADIARMRMGGGFKYTPKPYDLASRRTGFGKFLRDEFGLYEETFAGEREALAKKQAESITAGLSGYDKYGAPSAFDRAQGTISFDPKLLQTAAEYRAEQLSITNLSTAQEKLAEVQENRKYAKNRDDRAGKIHDVDIAYKEEQLAEQKMRNKALRVKMGQESVVDSEKLMEAIQQNDSEKIEFYQNKINTLDVLLNISDNVVAQRSAILEADKAYNVAFKPEEKNSAGIVTKPQQGYSPAQSKAIRDKVTMNVLLSQFNSVSPDMIQTISSNRLVTTGLSPAQIESAKIYSSVNQLAKMTSSPEADEDSKIKAGIAAYIQKYAPEASDEQIQSFENTYYMTRKLLTGRGSIINQTGSQLEDTNVSTGDVSTGDADDLDAGVEAGTGVGTSPKSPEPKPEPKPVPTNRRGRRRSQAKVRKEPEVPTNAEIEDTQRQIDRLESSIASYPDWSSRKPAKQKQLDDLYLRLRLLKALSQ